MRVRDLGPGQRQAHPAQAQRRVLLVAHGQTGAVGLVRAQIQGADGHRPPAHAEHRVAVGAELLFLVGQRVALQEQEFGAVQAQAVGAQRMRAGHVVARLGIGQQHDIDPVAGAAGFGAQLAEAALQPGLVAHAGTVVAQVVGGGLDDHRAAYPVHDQHVAVVDLLQRIGDADHQRQVQAARQDRAVRQRAADAGDDADHALRLQLRQFRRRHVLAYQYLAGQAGAVGLALLQERMDAPDHMVQIVHAAFQVGVFHGVEHGRQAVALQAQGIVGAVAAGADQFVQAVQQFRVVEQQRVQVEELADLLGQGAVQALAQAVHFLARGVHRQVQAFQFLGNLRGADALFGHVQRVRQAHACAAQRVAARGAVAVDAQAHRAPPPRHGRVVACGGRRCMLSCPRRSAAQTGRPRPPARRLRRRRPPAPSPACLARQPAASPP